MNSGDFTDRPGYTAAPIISAPAGPSSRLPRWARLLIIDLVFGVSCVFLLASIVLPNLGRAREPATRIKCASNLRQIGQACQMYASAHDGQYPDSLATLMVDEDLSSGLFVCPTSDDVPANGPTTQPLLADFAKPGHCSYVYLGKGLTSHQATPGTVIAYEPFSNHGNQGMNVLYGDGAVDWFDPQQAQRLLSELQSGHNPPRNVQRRLW